jgi:ABC-type multidrug transport system fused ATPase/permease subunit
MQLGMIAANRVLRLLIRKTKYKIQEKLKHRYLLEILVLRTFVSYIADEEVIKGIDLEVQSGQTIAIVGSTGAGKKSTIILNRFYEIAGRFVSIMKISKTIP